jgi:hypothetical protein
MLALYKMIEWLFNNPIVRMPATELTAWMTDLLLLSVGNSFNAYPEIIMFLFQ